MEKTIKATPLLAQHEKEHAKLIPFAGWQMPLEYRGILEEHRSVRRAKGLFDLSHMGEIEVTGPGAGAWLDRFITNKLEALKPGQALYTVICREDGGILDDLVVYRLDGKFMLVVNAANTRKIIEWLEAHKTPEASFRDRTEEIALLAVQGPEAQAFLQPFSSIPLDSIGYYHGAEGKVAECPALVSRTGYTGEDGFELYVEAARAPRVWEALRAREIPPVGLGARDTLRLEAAYLLYGNDMDETTTPLEVGLSWVVKLEKDDFVGKKVLEDQKRAGLRRKLVAFAMQDRSVPRKGYKLHIEGKFAGQVTSGSYSPTLEKGIGLALVETGALEVPVKEGTGIQVEIRGEPHPAVVCKKPFVQGSVKRGT